MAEYIDRKGLMKNLSPIIYKDGYIVNNTASKIVYEIQCESIADVVNREKIDKAIEELRKEIEENHLNVIDYANGEWIVKDFVYGAIERLKRNLGE